MGHLHPDFSEDTVVVTGGSSGIGREIALRFARAGATVVSGDVRKEPKDGEYPTHELVTDAGGTAVYVETDVSDVPDLENLVDTAREHGGVDVMVNNAAIATGGSFLEVTPEQFDEIHRVCPYCATFELIEATLTTTPGSSRSTMSLAATWVPK